MGKTQAKQLKNTSFCGIVEDNMIMDSNHEIPDFQIEYHSLIWVRVHSIHDPHQANQESKIDYTALNFFSQRTYSPDLVSR